jgi:hypothetical protein
MLSTLLVMMIIPAVYLLYTGLREVWNDYRNKYVRNYAVWNTIDGAEHYGFSSFDECGDNLVAPLMNWILASRQENSSSQPCYYGINKDGIVAWIGGIKGNKIEMITLSYRNNYCSRAVLKAVYPSRDNEYVGHYHIAYIYNERIREAVFACPHYRFDATELVRKHLEFNLTAFPVRMEVFKNSGKFPMAVKMIRSDNPEIMQEVRIRESEMISFGIRYGIENEYVSPDYALFSGSVVSVSKFNNNRFGYDFAVITVNSEKIYVNLIVNSGSLNQLPRIGDTVITNCRLIGNFALDTVFSCDL